jgi:uncharacterized protein
MATVYIAIPQKAIEAYCARNQIRKLSLFGSVLTNRFRAESDVDMLVEFEPDARVGYLALARMERELGELIGRKVDLRTAAELSRHFRDKVVAEALAVYERT